MSGSNLEDDYVAELLKKDAKASSSRYAAVGLQAFLPKRPNGQAPKPNTRFLRNILRETDSHNTALLAKEAEESRARLRAWREGQRSHGAGQEESPAKNDREQRNAREEIRKPSKRRRVEEEDEIESKRRHHRNGESSSHRSRRDDASDRDYKREKRSRYTYEGEDDYGERRSRHHKSHHKSHQHRRRSNSRRRTTEDTDGSHRRSRRERSASTSRSRSPGESRSRRKSRRSRRSPSRTSAEPRNPSKEPSKKSRSKAIARARSPASDSDPLEAIVGPSLPPAEPKVRSRGRGTFTSSAAIDAHFASNYDPSQDVHPNSDLEDDWDQALEALQDRQRWKQQGADRLKAAGFTDEEIRKWEKGGEKTEEDVRWRKKGEGREWDRGKVVGDDGHIDLRAEWGRLKDT